MVLDRPELGHALRRRVRVLQHDQRRGDLRVPRHTLQSNAQHPVAQRSRQDGLVLESTGWFQGKICEIVVRAR